MYDVVDASDEDDGKGEHGGASTLSSSSHEEMVDDKDRANEDAKQLSSPPSDPAPSFVSAATESDERISFHSPLHFLSSPVIVCRLCNEHRFRSAFSNDRIRPRAAKRFWRVATGAGIAMLLLLPSSFIGIVPTDPSNAINCSCCRRNHSCEDCSKSSRNLCGAMISTVEVSVSLSRRSSPVVSANATSTYFVASFVALFVAFATSKTTASPSSSSPSSLSSRFS
mmetsp:Transcript_23276/g.56169  ORF Transcript_23276/g.56169 Transcript_23276/m.56169 type:complete len:225 (-) Transcript_23276:61-735(-)